MGASVGGAKAINARRGRRGSRHGAISEINVTPLVDVMLVLLIVFMVAAPLMTVGVPVELPKTEAKAMDAPKEPLYITVQKDRTVYIQETQIPLDQLAAKLSALVKNGNEEQLFVRADTSTDYGAVMEVMGVLNASGYKKIGLVTLQKEQPVAP
ncbi:MAG: biopolymer transporter ExbD [Rhizobiales bacterium]|nr:biopolymer transporter ExbD [Hyphomicrobiales bacterium]